MTYCRRCKTDGVLYGSWPYQVKCPYTGELHYRGEECNVEFEPVKHGKWIKRPDERICPFCNDRYNYFGGAEKNYCSNCGAKMDLDD